MELSSKVPLMVRSEETFTGGLAGNGIHASIPPPSTSWPSWEISRFTDTGWNCAPGRSGASEVKQARAGCRQDLTRSTGDTLKQGADFFHWNNSPGSVVNRPCWRV